MKTIPPPCLEPETGPKYWRSLDQLADTPEFRTFVEREFPAGIGFLEDPQSRRHFVKIMSASFLLAGFGLTGCRRPEENILPFSKAPENYIYGAPKFYATSMPSRGSALPLVAKSYDGRPTKIEGNPQHPDSNGGTDHFAQASILNLYDPDRAQRFTRKGETVAREAVLDQLVQIGKEAQTKGGQGLAFLVGRSGSPSRMRLQQGIQQKLPQAGWFVYEPVDLDYPSYASSVALKKPVAPYYRIDRAKVIVTLDSDFLCTEADSTVYTRRYAKGRRIRQPDDEMNRLYAIESLMTLTGANADHRLRLAPSQIPAAAARLVQQVLGQGAGGVQGLNELAQGAKGSEQWLAECAQDLMNSRGKSLVIAGHRQPLVVQLLAIAMNAALGNIGETVVYHEAPQAKEGTLAELAQALNAGQIENLVILGGNPVYDAPADLSWNQTQRKAANIVRLGYYEDETFAVSDWHLPEAHYLESWGDGRTADGTVVSVQPLIEPLFGGMTEIEVLARIAGIERNTPYEIVRETFQALGGKEEEQWKKFLHDGYLGNSAYKPAQVQVDNAALSQAIAGFKSSPAPSSSSLDVIFHRDYSVDDGRYNNNGWLQELPDPITKLTWENVALLSPKTAKELGVYFTNPERLSLPVPMIRIDLGGRSIEAPVWIQPGQADNTLGLALGYGRERTGRVGHGAGYNAYKLRSWGQPNAAAGAKITALGRTHLLACTQDHWAMEGRPIVREANLDQFKKHPNFARRLDMEKPPSTQPLYPNPLDRVKAQTANDPTVHQWGMSIDLNTCVGCAACMVACQSENNIPIVGKAMVAYSREMHWIRIDRYFAGALEDPQVVNQPMLCQHCESAPCENVCPVNATVHDYEGLNLMVYNRCVGTRYCSNNCPYKVRRFNYFDYNRRPLTELYKTPFFKFTDGEWEMKRWYNNPSEGSKPGDEWELLKMVRNPDVTVRMRGVMEKCTFCVQRIEQAKIAVKVKARASGDVEVKDGMVQTACQQACPAEAIVFGNIKDPTSRVSELKKQSRDYSVLEFLGTKPRLTYLARVRNPNPKMPDYREWPMTLQEYSNKHGNPFAHEGGTEEGAAAHEKGAH